MGTIIIITGGKKKKKKKHCCSMFSWHPNEVSFFINLKTKGTITMQTAKVDQKFIATWPAPKDKYGNEATVQEGSTKFVSDDEEIATVEPNPDGTPYSAVVTTKKKVGSTMVRIKADGDLGEGEREIEGTLTVEVLSGDAVGFAEATTTAPEDNLDTEE